MTKVVPRLEVELTWDVRQYVSLEAKELREQVTDGPRIYFPSG